MQTLDKRKYTRESIIQVPVRISVANRLAKYISEQRIRPLKTDVASKAIEEWLDKQESGK